MMLAALEGPDLLIVLVIALVLFGGSRLPGLARSLGEAQREFHKATRPGENDDPPPAKEAETVTLSRAEYEQLVEQKPTGEPDAPPRRRQPLRAPSKHTRR